MMALDQHPTEEWGDYVARLERTRLQARGEQEENEARALEAIGEQHNDPELKVAARARRAAAQEFFRAVEDMERGAE